MANASKKTGKKTLKNLLAKTKQRKPQSESYSHKRDQEQKAKPAGWRFTDAGASALKVRKTTRPTAVQIEMYKNKKTKSGDRYIYQENRIDKSDVNQREKFGAGGLDMAGYIRKQILKIPDLDVQFKVEDNGDVINIEPTQYKDKKLDGMQILYIRNERMYEVSEYQAGPKQDELHIYKETPSLKLAIKELLKGNKRKPIKVWDNDASHKGPKTPGNSIDNAYYKESVEYLKKSYSLDPNDLDISEASAADAKSQGLSPKEYIDGLADKYGLDRTDKWFEKGGPMPHGSTKAGNGPVFKYGGAASTLNEDLYFLWRTDHASYKAGKWFNTGKYNGAVNNSSGQYVKNSSADKTIESANSSGITEEQLMNWGKEQGYTATDWIKQHKKYSVGGKVEGGDAYRGVLMKYTVKNGKRVSEYSYATVGTAVHAQNRFRDATPITINTHFSHDSVHGKTFYASDVERFTYNSGKDKGFIIYVEFPVKDFKDVKGLKQITMSYVSNWLRPEMVGKAKGGVAEVNEQFAKGGKTRNDDSPKIYVADLAAYNEGKLIGEWLDLDDYSSGSEVMEAIDDLLKKWSADQGVEREEYAIHDIENIPKSLYSEGMSESSFDKIYEIKEAAESTGLPFDVIVKWMEDTGHDNASDAAEAYQGEYDNMEDYAYRMVEEGVITDLSQYLMMSELDQKLYAGEDADHRLSDMSDEDILREAEMESEVEGLEEDSPEYNRVVSVARDRLHDDYYNEVYSQLDDPIQYFVEDQGLYSIEDLPNAAFIQVDYEKLGRDLGYDVNEVEYDGKSYIFSSNYKRGGQLKNGTVQGSMFEDGGAVPGNNYQRVITLGKVDYEGTGRKINEVEVGVEIRNKENAINWDTLETVHDVPEIAITGRVWNCKKTDTVAAGYILPRLPKFLPLGENKNNLNRLVSIWREYYNNDVKVGTIRQVEALQAAGITGDNYYYDEAVRHLKLIGLYEDNGYKYGSGYLYEPIPESIIAEIKKIADSFPEFSRYEEGGSLSSAISYAEAEASNTNFNSGGKILNIEANQYSEHRQPFKADNLEGKFSENGDYMVLSAGYYPIWYYSSKEAKWYGTREKLNEETSRHFTQSRPDWNAEILSHSDLIRKMADSNARFDLGGYMVRDYTKGPIIDSNNAHDSGANAQSKI